MNRLFYLCFSLILLALSPALSSIEVLSPMPGKVLRYHAEPGQYVRSGEPLLEIEIMKMYLPIFANASGYVHSLNIMPGQDFEAGGVVLARLSEEQPIIQPQLAHAQEDLEDFFALFNQDSGSDHDNGESALHPRINEEVAPFQEPIEDSGAEAIIAAPEVNTLALDPDQARIEAPLVELTQLVNSSEPFTIGEPIGAFVENIQPLQETSPQQSPLVEPPALHGTYEEAKSDMPRLTEAEPIQQTIQASLMQISALMPTNPLVPYSRNVAYDLMVDMQRLLDSVSRNTHLPKGSMHSIRGLQSILMVYQDFRSLAYSTQSTAYEAANKIIIQGTAQTKPAVILRAHINNSSHAEFLMPNKLHESSTSSLMYLTRIFQALFTWIFLSSLAQWLLSHFRIYKSRLIFALSTYKFAER